MNFLKPLFMFTFLGFTLSLEAASLYIPIDARINDDIERMIVLSNMPTMKKPYTFQSVQTYNEKIKDLNPQLHQRIEEYITSRNISKGISQERVLAEVWYQNSEQAIPNNHGITTKSNGTLQGWYFGSYNEYIKGSLEGELYRKDGHLAFMSNNTYISAGIDALQVDIGVRDHYYSPFKNGGSLISDNARNSPSITISNSKPFEFLDTNYEIFISQLAKVNGISHYITPTQSVPESGTPKMLGMHLDFSLFEGLEIGLDRTMQFGGRPGTDSIWSAFFNPYKSDNNNIQTTESANSETGNQEAGFTVKYSNILNHRIPFSLYGTYIGEDTIGTKYKPWMVGNVTKGFGIYLPFVTPKLSARYEFLDVSNAWYVHHIYTEGYRNYGSVMGGWYGDVLYRPGGSYSIGAAGTGGSMNFFETVYTGETSDWKAKIRTFKPVQNGEYHPYQSIEIQNIGRNEGIYNQVGLTVGKSIFGDHFLMISYGIGF